MGTRYAIHGQVSPGATITVYEADTLTQATIYAAQSGGSAIAGSQVTAGDDGRILFYNDEDNYSFASRFDVKATLAGYVDAWARDVWTSFTVYSTTFAFGSAVVDVCNEALVLIGQKKITAISDENNRATACRTLYPSVRDATLRAYPWNCAMVYATLTVDATAPAWGFSYRYPLPADCLRVLGMDANYRYKVVGRWLYTSDVSADANIRYTTLLSDPTTWDALLRKAIAAWLAAELAIPLSVGEERQKNMWALFERMRSEARGVDGQEGKTDKITATEFTDFRK